MSRSLIRTFTVAAVAAAAVGLTALPALAHVTVNSPGATQGGFGVLTFRMPNEIDNANATELKVQLPADAAARLGGGQAEAGWTYTVTRAKLSQPITDDDGNQVTDYLSVIDWKATAGGIKPGEYDDFDLSVGPLPKGRLDDVQGDPDLQRRPDRVLDRRAGRRQHRGARAPGADAEAGPGRWDGGRATTEHRPGAGGAASSDDGASKGSVTGAYVVGGIGLVAGLAALGVAVTGRRRHTAVEQGPDRVTSGV